MNKQYFRIIILYDSMPLSYVLFIVKFKLDVGMLIVVT